MALKKQEALDEIIIRASKGAHTKNNLIYHIKKKTGNKISERTFERYISELRNEHGYEIKYVNGSYKIDRPENLAGYKLRVRAKAYNTLANRLVELKGTNDYIMMQESVDEELADKILFISDAIKSRRQIRFSYFSYLYNTKNDFERVLDPYIIREYANEWYVIGLIKNKYRTYAIKRIDRLERTDFVFKLKKVDWEVLLHRSYGMYIPKDEENEVNIELIVSGIHSDYLREKPLHYTQELIEENEGSIRVSLFLVLNPQFLSALLSLGSSCEVIKPLELRNMLGYELTRMLEVYKI